MRIVSRIKSKRSNERTINVLGRSVRFERQVDGTYVADVADKDVQACLLGRPGDFWEAGATSPTLKREAAQAQKDPTKPVDPAIAAEATALLELSLADMGKAIGNVSSVEVLRVAVELEKGGQDRKGAAELLNVALEAAKQAGVS